MLSLRLGLVARLGQFEVSDQHTDTCEMNEFVLKKDSGQFELVNGYVIRNKRDMLYIPQTVKSAPSEMMSGTC